MHRPSLPCPGVAFAAPQPLPFQVASTSRVVRCALRAPSPCPPSTASSPRARSRMSGVGASLAAVAAAIALTLGGLGGPGRVGSVRAAPAKTEATASRKNTRYDGRQELGGAEKAASLALTGGAFAVMAAFAYRKGRIEDALEMVRIKEEVERLEKLKAEFEVDEDEDGDGEFTGVDDDEFMKQLNKRILSGEGGEGGEGEGGEDGDEGEGESESSGSVADGDGDGGDGDGGGSDSEGGDIEALKRMWQAESQDGSGKGSEGK